MNASFGIKFSKIIFQICKVLEPTRSFRVTRSRNLLSKRMCRQRDTFFLTKNFYEEERTGGFSRGERALFSFGYATDCFTRPFRPFHLDSTFVDVVVSGRVLSTSSTVGLSGSQAGTKHGRFTTFPRHNFPFHTHLKSAPYFSFSPSLHFFPFLSFFFFFWRRRKRRIDRRASFLAVTVKLIHREESESTAFSRIALVT